MQEAIDQQAPAQTYIDEIPTRNSLLLRLRNWNDNESWVVFFETYWRLIYKCAIRSGLNDAESQDVVQETLIAVLKGISAFAYDPAKGGFKSWLLKVTYHRITDHFRRVSKEKTLISPPRAGFSSETATVEKIPDPKGIEIFRIWNEEWESNLMAAALERLKQKVDLKHYQIFDLCMQGLKAGDVARALRVRRAYVYVTKHRVQKILRQEVKSLLANPIYK